MSLPASETLNWIAQSSAPILIRSLLMKALLRRYGSCIPDAQWVHSGKPLGNLIRTAMRLWPYPSTIWKKVPEASAQAARWIHIEQQLKQHLSSHELAFWKLAVENIVQVIWLSRDHILLIELPQNWCCSAQISGSFDRYLNDNTGWRDNGPIRAPPPLPQDEAWQEIPKTVNECMQLLQEWTES